jgi:TRAP transporter TAXI family solute receptor
MKMKFRLIATLALLIMCLSTVLACGAPETATPTETTTPTETATPTETPTETAAPGPDFGSMDLPETMMMSVANPAPTELIELVAAIISENTPIMVSTEKVSPNSDALMRIADAAGVLTITGEGCVACHHVAVWSVAQQYYDATIFTLAGTATILDPDRGNLRALFTGHGPVASEPLAIQTLPDSGIKTVADLKGKKVYADYPNLRFLAPTMDIILEANGMTREDVEWLPFPTSSQAFEDLAAGDVDAVFYVIGGDAEALAAADGIFFVPLSDETQQAVTASDYGFIALEWPEGMLPGVPSTPVIAAPRVAWVPSQTTDDTAYIVTRTVMENLARVQAESELGVDFTLETALSQWTLPYHPGAIKYFEEIGIWTTEMDAKQAALITKWTPAD